MKPNVQKKEDSFSIIVKILPELLRFCIICLTSRREIVQISALKTLKFVFETQGCSLDFNMVFILQSIFGTFPRDTTQRDVRQSEFNMEALGQNQKELCVQATKIVSVTEPTSGFKTALSSVYTHVLDSFISVLSSVSSHILHSIFYKVIGDCLTNRRHPPEVCVYSCKIAEKIITIC
jgi:hypothetical protein